MIDQVWARVKLIFAQGKGLRVTANHVQVVVLEDEPLDNIKRVEPYGFSYRAQSGHETYMVFPNGDRTLGLALICGDKRYQMDLQNGEVAIHDDEENWVYIKRGGIIEVKAATKVIADTPLFETTQDAKIGGNLLVVGQTTSNQGYGGENGGRAWLHNGVLIENGTETHGALTSNGKNVSDSHAHTAPGGQTGGVI